MLLENKDHLRSVAGELLYVIALENQYINTAYYSFIQWCKILTSTQFSPIHIRNKALREKKKKKKKHKSMRCFRQNQVPQI